MWETPTPIESESFAAKAQMPNGNPASKLIDQIQMPRLIIVAAIHAHLRMIPAPFGPGEGVWPKLILQRRRHSIAIPLLGRALRGNNLAPS